MDGKGSDPSTGEVGVALSCFLVLSIGLNLFGFLCCEYSG